MSTSVFVDPESSTQADRAQSSGVPVPLSKDPYEAIRQAYLVGTDTESEPFEGKARTHESPHIVVPPTCHVEESEGSRYKGKSKLILGTDSEEDEEVEESPDSDSESEGAEDEGPTTEDEDHVARDEGLAARVEGLDMDDESYGLDDESYGLDDESHGVDDEIHGVDDESRGLDNEGHGVEIDGLGLEEEEVVPEGQQWAASVIETVVSAPLGLGYGALRHRELALEGDHIYSTFEVGQGSDSAPEPERPDRTPPLPEWTSGSLLISPSPSVVPSPVSSPMIPLIVPSPIASPMATSIATILVDEDQFIEVGAQLKLYRSILQDHTQHLDAMPPTLFAEIDRDEMTVVTFGALWRPVLTLEACAGHRFVARATGDERSCYCIRAGKEP
uniref:Uncharacterized protein n=1 Tax=Tanacetum cinerariifolium TaxID=118510 RepID=A0A699JIB9_TANCI|nr:hypothetical protein [Tanacetum cinerariifolium]